MYGLLMRQEEWKALPGQDLIWPMEYIFAYMAEDWNEVLTDVKIVKATTEAIAGPNPTMELRAYMSVLNNFTVQFSIIKDVLKFIIQFRRYVFCKW